MLSDFLRFSPRVACLPIIHGSGDFAVEVRRVMLAERFDCLAVPLPPSFQADVERAIDFLPAITLVTQEEPRIYGGTAWTGDSENEDEDDQRTLSYIPVDPCQGVIAALRIAMQEHMPRAFVDLETARFESRGAVLPDPYALKQVSADRFAAAVLPALPPLPEGQPRQRAATMAARLRELERRHESILFVCSITDWPWVREAYRSVLDASGVRDADRDEIEDDAVEETRLFAADPQTLVFLLGELPFVTGLYERARADLDDDENLSIDGLKALLLATRDRYRIEFGKRAQSITPKMLSIYFQYVRNLALVERRMTPDLYTLIVAAQQIMGDQFALALTETAREYAPASGGHDSVGRTSVRPAGDADRLKSVLQALERFRMGIGEGRMPDGDVVQVKNRLPGQVLAWRSCELRPKPPKINQDEWRLRWNPFAQCSWPAEDVAIEKFRTRVKDAAQAIIGTDLARSEKFTTSLKDGLDIRETLRNWHTGEFYVKVFPPTRGNLDCVVMLFDSPADPRDYPWRITWHAEHHDESTLALFATNFRQEMVGPGIGLAQYGGAMFLFPPRPIEEIWDDPQFDFCDTLEERLLAAACRHSTERHVALLSAAPPGPGWRRLAKRYGKKLVHIPISRFSQSTIAQLRMFHVLNGQPVRSYAAHFIRKA